MHCATEIYPHVAVATDMRNSLMFELERVSGEVPRTEGIIRIKECIADVFAPYVDCYLIDPIYGMGIFEKYRGRKKFICALEVSDGFTYDRKHRFPRLIPELDLKDLKTAGIIAVKLLVYFNVDDDGVSDKKIEFAKTVSQSCAAQGLQVIFEPVLYDMRNDCERNDSIRLEMAKKLADLVSPMRCFIAGFMLETPISTSDLSDEMVANEIHRYFSSYNKKITAVSEGLNINEWDLYREIIKINNKNGGILYGFNLFREVISYYYRDGAIGAKAWLETLCRENFQRLDESANK